jgi:hypothetical protein
MKNKENRFHQRSYHWNDRCSYRIEIQSKIVSVCCWRYSQVQNITDKHLNNELSVLLLKYDCRFVTIVDGEYINSISDYKNSEILWNRDVNARKNVPGISLER